MALQPHRRPRPRAVRAGGRAPGRRRCRPAPRPSSTSPPGSGRSAPSPSTATSSWSGDLGGWHDGRPRPRRGRRSRRRAGGRLRPPRRRLRLARSSCAARPAPRRAGRGRPLDRRPAGRRASRGWSSRPAPTATSRSSRCSLSTPDADALVVPDTDLVVGKAARVGHLAVQDLGLGVWQLGHQRSTVDADATLTAAAAAFGGRYARLRTDCRLAGRGATGNLPCRLVRRGRPAPRLPHLPGPRRARHHQRPRLQGRRRRAEPQRLHRAHQGPARRPGHQRLPDQPQPQAVRRRLGRVGAQPRDREQRRPLLRTPRPSGPSTRSSAGTSRAAACRRRSPSASSSPASSRRSSARSPCPPRPGRSGRRSRQARSASGRPMSVNRDPQLLDVGALDDLEPGAATRFDVDGRRIALVRIDDDRLRHRRPLHPRRRVARRGRGRRRRSAPSSAGSTAASSPSRPASRCRCRRRSPPPSTTSSCATAGSCWTLS